MSAIETTEISASEAANLICDGTLQISSYYDPIINRLEGALKYANIFDQPEQVTELLKTAPREVKKKKFCSIPLLISSSIDAAGLPTTAGMASLKKLDAVPYEECAVLTALKNEGALVIGQATQTPLHLGFGCPAKNPYSNFAAAGSGVPAGVSARVAALGLSFDQRGEGRVSAGICGCVAFRPTTGRYPLEGVLSTSPTLDSLALVARNVEDLQLADAVVVAHLQKSTCPSCPNEDCASKANAEGDESAYVPNSLPDLDNITQSLNGVRIGIPRGSEFFGNLHPNVSLGIENFLSRLEKAGAELVTIDMGSVVMDDKTPCQLAGEIVETVSLYEAAKSLGFYLYTHSRVPPVEEDEEESEEEDYDEEEEKPAEPEPPAPVPLDSLVNVSDLLNTMEAPPSLKDKLLKQLNFHTAISNKEYLHALVQRRPALISFVHGLFAQYNLDTILIPQACVPALPIRGTHNDQIDTAGTGKLFTAADVYYRNSSLASSIGFPAVTLPVGYSKPKPGAVKGSSEAERLPIAVEFVGPLDSDSKILSIALACQHLQSPLPDPVVLAKWQGGV